MKKILILIFIFTINCTYAFEHKKDVFIIVTGLGTGKYLAPAFRGYGHDVIHVSSKLQQNLGFNENKHDYIAHYYEPSNINSLIFQLKKHKNIKAVIAGTEGGVDLAEKLNWLLKLPYSNDSKLLHTRRNKFNQQEALKKANIRSISQYLTKDLSKIIEWKKKNNINFPIVLKPIESSASDNVFICKNDKDVEIAFSKIISSVDHFQNKNQYVLCQEYIGGQEYMVNTVSWDKKHRIIELLKINKKIVNGHPLYDTLHAVGQDSDDFQLIDSYLKRVYKTLGINYGAAHAEVKVWNKNNKKVVTLIELGTRLGGVAGVSALQESQGYSQTSVLVNSYINPGSLNGLPDNLHLKKKVAAVFLINNSYSGNVVKNFDPNIFYKLKTYHSLNFLYKKGSFLPITTDLFTTPGFIYLLGDDEEEIEKDIKIIRKLENKIYKDLLGK